MGQNENQPEYQSSGNSEAAEHHLRAITEELHSLQQNLTSSLSQEIQQLQARKTRLLREVEQLELQHRQQVAKQQDLAQKIAPTLVQELQKLLQQRLQEHSDRSPESPSSVSLTDYNENAYKLISSLDSTLRTIFQTLEKDVSSYQSSLSQQLNQMYNLEQQAEGIMETLINRLQEKLPPKESTPPETPKSSLQDIQAAPEKLNFPPSQPSQPPKERPIPKSPEPSSPVAKEELPAPPLKPKSSQLPSEEVSRVMSKLKSSPTQSTRQTPPPPSHSPFPTQPASSSSESPQERQNFETAQEPVVPIEPKPTPPPAPPQGTPERKKPSKFKLGFTLVLLSALALSFYNVVIAALLNGAEVFWGLFTVEKVLSTSLGNSLLILWLRMLIVVPLMAILASFLYKKTWGDIADTFKASKWNLWLKILGSGFCLFLSQVLIYLAFGSGLSPGEVITIFFIFPIVTLLLSWLFFKEKPSLIRSMASITVFVGVLVTSIPKMSGAVFPLTGLVASVASGIAFALYVLLTQACAKKIHPVPFSVLNFVTILVFSGLSFFSPTVRNTVAVSADNYDGLVVGGLILGGLTLISYLFNNIGISIIGAARASIFGATGPVLTSLLAWMIIGEALTPFSVAGMLIVTAGIAALSFERLRGKPNKPKAATSSSR